MAGQCGTEGHGHSDHKVLSQFPDVMIQLTVLPESSVHLQGARHLPSIVDMENLTAVLG